MEARPKKKAIQANYTLIGLIGIVFTAGMLFAISFVMFINSDTKNVIEAIESTSKIDESLEASANIDTTSQVTSQTLDEVEKLIDAEVLNLDESVDFNASELNDAALGL